MNNQDLPSDDTDWIYSRKELKKMKSLRNPLDDTQNVSDLDQVNVVDTVFDQKDPLFDETSTHSVHTTLRTALEQKTSLDFGSNKLQSSPRVHSESLDTIEKMAEGTATKEDLRKVLHNYDPFCKCNRCVNHFQL